jgi:diacylglycerol kinase family enzyme
MQQGARELFLVFNPGSGSQDKLRARDEIEQVLVQHGHPHRFVEAKGGDVAQVCRQAARLAAEAGGALVSVGGDGTLNAAAQAAMNAGCVLGVVPQGTFNVFAREHGIPLDPAGAARVLIDDFSRELRVGSCNQHVFLVNASLGLYPKLLRDREEAKRRFGRKRWVAAIAALRSLAQWHSALTLETELDGEPMRLVTASIFVSNNRLQLENVGAPEPVLDEVEGGARLGGVAVRPLSGAAKLRLAVDGALGRLAKAPEVDTFAFSHLNVSAAHARRLRVAMDGEVGWLDTPLLISVAAQPLRVLLPRRDARPET